MFGEIILISPEEWDTKLLKVVNNFLFKLDEFLKIYPLNFSFCIKCKKKNLKNLQQSKLCQLTVNAN